MPRSVWRGTISFGLVTVQVRLYPAIKRRSVRFHELDRRTGQRVRHHRFVGPARGWEQPDEQQQAVAPRLRPTDDEARVEPQPVPEPAPEDRPAPAVERPPAREVQREELVRGYEYAPGRFVAVTDEELADLAPERTKTIDVEQFVSRGELDPVFFDASYFVLPEGSPRPFAVLLRAMQQTNRAAVCWIVLRSRRHLAVIQPRAGLMLLTTLLFSDEVLPVDRLQPVLPDDLQERETEMAELLLDTLAGPWEPERYRDEYREKVRALVEGRAAAEEFVQDTQESPPTPAGVDELLAALKASVEEARTRRGQRDREQVRRRRGA